jgi:glycosyltransferase involved in cell wall biosynthesis
MSVSSLVSVIIPVFNGEKYLREAIESALGQTYKPVEIIVVDDGSTDGSAEIAKSFVPHVRYVFKSHGGLAAALNYGISLSRGDFLSFLDADDLWVEDKLALQMTAFDNDPALDAVFGHAKQFWTPELVKNNKIRVQTEIMPAFLKGAMLIRRDAFFRVGTFDTRWEVGESIDWFLKAEEKGLKTSMLPETVVKRRIHADNVGIRKRDARGDLARMLKESLDRRRANGRIL